MNRCHHVKYALLSDFNHKWNMLTNFSKTLQFEEAQKSCFWFLTSYIPTDRHIRKQTGAVL